MEAEEAQVSGKTLIERLDEARHIEWAHTWAKVLFTESLAELERLQAERDRYAALLDELIACETKNNLRPIIARAKELRK